MIEFELSSMEVICWRYALEVSVGLRCGGWLCGGGGGNICGNICACLDVDRYPVIFAHRGMVFILKLYSRH